MTPKDWRFCEHRWPRTSAHRSPKNRPKQGWRWPQTGSRDLHRDDQWELLDHARRVDGARGTATSGAGAGKLERQRWRCGFSPAERNALKAKTDSTLATSAGTFVAAPKHFALEWVASGPRKAHHGVGSHHGRNHSLQRLRLPHGGVDGAQPADTGGDEPRKFKDARRYKSWRAISTWSLRPLGNTPHPRD